jgi:hypothetical protein
MNMLELHSTVKKRICWNVIVGLVQELQLICRIFSADDGIEFFGGTVNTLLDLNRNEDDQFDWTEGWSGTNTNWYGKLGFGKGNRGIEANV